MTRTLTNNSQTFYITMSRLSDNSNFFTPSRTEEITMTKKTAKLSERVDLKQYEPKTSSLESVVNVPITITDVEVRRGDLGKYWLIHATNNATGEELQINSSSQAINAVIEGVMDGGAWPEPLETVVLKENRAYYFA